MLALAGMPLGGCPLRGEGLPRQGTSKKILFFGAYCRMASSLEEIRNEISRLVEYVRTHCDVIDLDEFDSISFKIELLMQQLRYFEGKANAGTHLCLDLKEMGTTYWRSRGC